MRNRIFYPCLVQCMPESKATYTGVKAKKRKKENLAENESLLLCIQNPRRINQMEGLAQSGRDSLDFSRRPPMPRITTGKLYWRR
ncbi:hypothetical protein RRG08_052841 [Elysia crispata]|uniref:Uncharacterized protein n=1 Tax=Elysia crispata TaxID=231223 RepID=A0AAE1DSH9_9GAST|nr:hypothetical protein RRG08_052841 [Elysia crispata]